MTAATFNFTLEQHAPESKTIQIKDSTGVIKNLTGYQGYCQLRPYPGSPDILLSLSSTDNSIVISPSTGEVTLIFTKEDTLSLKINRCFYDVFLTSQTDTLKPIAGEIFIKEAVTVWPM